MFGLEAWENYLFDRHNGERQSEDEIIADLYDELDNYKENEEAE